jgi:hypothetical protein
MFTQQLTETQTTTAAQLRAPPIHGAEIAQQPTPHIKHTHSTTSAYLRIRSTHNTLWPTKGYLFEYGWCQFNAPTCPLLNSTTPDQLRRFRPRVNCPNEDRGRRIDGTVDSLQMGRVNWVAPSLQVNTPVATVLSGSSPIVSK